MIDLRYHIVSLVAVFLALALGILLGSSVVSTPLEARLHDDLRRANEQRDEARSRAVDLEGDNEALQDRLVTDVAPWALAGRLEGERFVVVDGESETSTTRAHLVDSLTAAGAEHAGTLTLNDKLDLKDPEDSEELVDTVTAVVPNFEPGASPGVTALRLLGQRFTEPTGRSLIEALADAAFVSVDGDTGDGWPPNGSMVAMVSESVRGDEAPIPGSGALVRSVTDAVPAIVVSEAPTGRSVVTELRELEDLADTLATFDAATTEADPGGVGVTAALVAASEGRGGHFGTGEGLSFVAPPPPIE